MHSMRGLGALAALIVVATMAVAAQVGGKPVSGNPTPGTEQPAPPNHADRITLTGCLRPAPKSAQTEAPDSNAPSDARFVLANAERVDRVPPGTGGSSQTATAASSRSYRLSGIDSQFSPFVDTKVEISGEINAVSTDPTGTAPTLIVEFVQKLASSCR
jgi:hypothetical protein